MDAFLGVVLLASPLPYHDAVLVDPFVQ